MSQLRELQHTLQAHLLSDDAKIEQYIQKPLNDSRSERLAIYNNGYFARLLEVLEKQYEVLLKWLGEDEFSELAAEYITANPSHFYAIGDFARFVPRFLKDTKPYADKPYLTELASFIIALSDTIDAADAPVLIRQDIMHVPSEDWPSMRLSLHPSVQLFTHQWNSIAIWEAITSNSIPPTPIQLNALCHGIVWRKGIQSFYVVVTQAEASVLKYLQNVHSFAEICEGLTQIIDTEEVAQYVVNLLIRWLNDGLITSINFGDNT